jgi:hypothetical protein
VVLVVEAPAEAAVPLVQDAEAFDVDAVIAFDHDAVLDRRAIDAAATCRLIPAMSGCRADGKKKRSQKI